MNEALIRAFLSSDSVFGSHYLLSLLSDEVFPELLLSLVPLGVVEKSLSDVIEGLTKYLELYSLSIVINK